MTVTSYYSLAIVVLQQKRIGIPYADIVDHHLIESGGAKGALHHIGDSLGRKDYINQLAISH